MVTSTQLPYQSFLKEIQQSGLSKEERQLSSAQGADITVEPQNSVINFCANNYLGLANHPAVIAAAKEGLDRYGYGLSSVRFICGTQTIHKQLEAKLSDFLSTEDAILYSSCFDANGGLFEPLLDEHSAVISDALNHASIIDGIRLCKAKRYRYAHSNMDELEQMLIASQNANIRLIATDGVFSMDGDIAQLQDICRLAQRYNALVMVDDSHGIGVLGAKGRGSTEHHDVLGQVDIMTGTFGKALGGAMGGFTAGRQDIVALLRQRSRPYLFSNSLAPVVTYTSLKVLELLDQHDEFRDRLMANTQYFRHAMTARGFQVQTGIHPIVPIMLYDAKLATDIASDLLDAGIYVIGFSYPVVPQGQARIRVQISAEHTRAHLDHCIEAFTAIAKDYDVL